MTTVETICSTLNQSNISNQQKQQLHYMQINCTHIQAG